MTDRLAVMSPVRTSAVVDYPPMEQANRLV